MRGDGDESNGILKQLLRMKAEEDPNLAEWLKRKENVYTSPDVQNELLKVMGLQVLRGIATVVQHSPFLTVMVDETSDVSNREQVSMIVRQVTEDLQVHKEFVGLYCVPSIDAATLSTIVKDPFTRMNLCFGKLCGQCYDGASAMSGSK